MAYIFSFLLFYVLAEWQTDIGPIFGTPCLP